MEKTKNIIIWILLSAVFLGVFTVLFLGKTAGRMSTLRADPSYMRLNHFQVETRSIDAYTGVEKRYTMTLPDIAPWGETLFAYFVHQYAEVWLDDTLVAVSKEAGGWHLGKTPGCYWLDVPVLETDAGKQLTIVSRPIYPAVVNRDPRVLLTSWDSALEVLVTESLGELILSLVCVVGGLTLMLITAALHMERGEKMQMLYLGAFTLSVGFWRLCDLQAAALLFPRLTGQMYFASMLGMMLAPLLFTRFLYWQYREDGRKPYGLLSLFFAAESALLLGLQLLNLLDLRSAVNVMFAGIVAAGIPICLQSLANLVRGKDRGIAVVFDGLYIAFVIAALLDVYRYLRLESSRFLTLFICVTVLHLFVMCAVIFRRAAERQKKTYMLEAELAEERTRVMLSQIQPHFLYNSLGVIRELCHSDPDKAEDATIRFSQYLRQNMESLSMDRPISFSKELKHTQDYLALEKLRFGDQLQVEYDITAQGFSLPALTLQPIVENAVRHGIRKQTNGGTIRIRTEEKEDSYQIVVQDDGPGFDPDVPPSDGKEHIGIQNVRHRLEIQCGGELKIDSAIGEGTRVMIKLPKNPERGKPSWSFSQ